MLSDGIGQIEKIGQLQLESRSQSGTRDKTFETGFHRCIIRLVGSTPLAWERSDLQYFSLLVQRRSGGSSTAGSPDDHGSSLAYAANKLTEHHCLGFTDFTLPSGWPPPDTIRSRLG